MIKKILKFDDVEGKVYELENWKPSHGSEVKKYFINKSNELKDEYIKLVNEFNLNKLIFESTITFKPIMGKKYYLYKNTKNERFLSLISPEEWNKKTNLEYLGAFRQDTSLKWVSVD